MGTIQLNSRVGEDGILHLAIPVGAAAANSEVLVTVQPAAKNESASQLDWADFINKTYGSCAGMGLEEPEDLPLQDREWPQ